jgi:hypothetical protein
MILNDLNREVATKVYTQASTASKSESAFFCVCNQASLQNLKARDQV